MKTMGLPSLILVSPKRYPDEEAVRRAAGAESVLDEARVVDDLTSVLRPFHRVFGTSVRDREVRWPTCSAEQAAKQVAESQRVDAEFKTAILFGREKSGLANDELDLCHQQIRIDANPEYSSLNLASAVQIIAYEMRKALVSESFDQGSHKRQTTNSLALAASEQTRWQQLASRAELEMFHQHLEKTLVRLDFIKTKPPTKLMRKLIRLYNKAELTHEEMQILRGILKATNDLVDKQLKQET